MSDRDKNRPIDCEARSVIQKFHDTLAIFLALMFLGIPLFLVLANGLSNLSSLPVAVWMAALRSVLIAGGPLAAAARVLDKHVAHLGAQVRPGLALLRPLVGVHPDRLLHRRDELGRRRHQEDRHMQEDE